MFLMGLLYLVSGDDLFSQQCFKVSYDKNGNRISFMSTNCSQYARDDIDNTDVVEDNGYEEQPDDLLVYPNPNNGIFRIEAKEDYDGAEIQIYDNKGALVKRCQFENGKEIDISNGTSGVYLLRIIKDEEVRSMVVLKL